MPELSKVEEQKMICGEPYNSTDPYLIQLQSVAREKIKMVDATRGNTEARVVALKNLLGSMADDKTIIESPVFFSYGKNTHVGKEFFMNAMGVILDHARVDIGDRVLFAPNVQIYTAERSIDPEKRIDGMETARPVKIGDNVWIGGGAVILPGVTIGNGVTVGAGAVVTKDVPDNVVVAGIPAKIIRKL